MSEPVENLSELLDGLDPVRRPGEFVFMTVDDVDHVPAGTHAVVREDGRLSCVVDRVEAAWLGEDEGPVLAWITLRVHSSLLAVGLTAAVSAALAAHGIAANVIAGHLHDHVLVPVAQVDVALELLSALSDSHS